MEKKKKGKIMVNQICWGKKKDRSVVPYLKKEKRRNTIS